MYHLVCSYCWKRTKIFKKNNGPDNVDHQDHWNELPNIKCSARWDPKLSFHIYFLVLKIVGKIID